MPVETTQGPLVAGPIEGGRRDRPFLSYPGDVARWDYSEEEYFLSGTASRYSPDDLTPDGHWSLEVAGTASYTTRILVRRPRDPAKFNGTVILEWLNVSSGYELTCVGDVQFDGFVYVGVSAQYLGVNGFAIDPCGLKQWDPERYARLSHPGESFSYDIFTQAARAVGPQRTDRAVDPLGGLAVRKIIATGGSQSAAKLLSYINGVQPVANVMDAIVPTVGRGLAAGFGDEVFDMTKPKDAMKAFFGTARVRNDLTIPVMYVNSENETLHFYPLRQRDNDRFRYWEVAGASHAPAQLVSRMAKARDHDEIGISIIAQSNVATGVSPSEVDWTPTSDAALVHVHHWINGGPPPPTQPLIEVEEGTPPRIVRDEFGIAVGGVRLPEVEVPIARNIGALDVADHLAGLSGLTEPFAPEQIKRLYPTHADYVARVTQAAEAAVRGGATLPGRVKEYVAEATGMAVMWQETSGSG